MKDRLSKDMLKKLKNIGKQGDKTKKKPSHDKLGGNLDDPHMRNTNTFLRDGNPNKAKDEKRSQDNTKRFLKAQKIEYKINKDIAENYRHWQGTAIDDYNLNPFGWDVFSMTKEQLVTTLGHCYHTMKHIHSKYLKTEEGRKEEEHYNKIKKEIEDDNKS